MSRLRMIILSTCLLMPIVACFDGGNSSAGGKKAPDQAPRGI